MERIDEATHEGSLGRSGLHTHSCCAGQLGQTPNGTPGPHFVVLYKQARETHRSCTLKKIKIPPLGTVFPLGTARTNTNIETYLKVLQPSWM